MFKDIKIGKLSFTLFIVKHNFFINLILKKLKSYKTIFNYVMKIIWFKLRKTLKICNEKINN